MKTYRLQHASLLIKSNAIGSCAPACSYQFQSMLLKPGRKLKSSFKFTTFRAGIILLLPIQTCMFRNPLVSIATTQRLKLIPNNFASLPPVSKSIRPRKTLPGGVFCTTQNISPSPEASNIPLSAARKSWR